MHPSLITKLKYQPYYSPISSHFFSCLERPIAWIHSWCLWRLKLSGVNSNNWSSLFKQEHQVKVLMVETRTPSLALQTLVHQVLDNKYINYYSFNVVEYWTHCLQHLIVRLDQSNLKIAFTKCHTILIQSVSRFFWRPCSLFWPPLCRGKLHHGVCSHMYGFIIWSKCLKVHVDTLVLWFLAIANSTIIIKSENFVVRRLQCPWIVVRKQIFQVPSVAWQMANTPFTPKLKHVKKLFS